MAVDTDTLGISQETDSVPLEIIADDTLVLLNDSNEVIIDVKNLIEEVTDSIDSLEKPIIVE